MPLLLPDARLFSLATGDDGSQAWMCVAVLGWLVLKMCFLAAGRVVVVLGCSALLTRRGALQRAGLATASANAIQLIFLGAMMVGVSYPGKFRHRSGTNRLDTLSGLFPNSPTNSTPRYRWFVINAMICLLDPRLFAPRTA